MLAAIDFKLNQESYGKTFKAIFPHCSTSILYCWLQAQKKQTFRDTIQNISQLWDKSFRIKKAEINDSKDIGYDTGEWREAWTEKGDTSKSELRGKYWRMWRRNNQWIIIAVVLTPLSCKGSYCNK
jgi:hypothetical protein